MTTPAPLEHIMYISIPEQTAGSIGSFRIDPDILIPVEIVGDDEAVTLENLSWEMILAAMLKVLVHDPDTPHRGYYREFILAAKPDIVEELSKTGVEQAERKNFDVAEEVFSALGTLLPADPAPGLNLALVYEERAGVYRKGHRSDLEESYREKAFTLYSILSRQHPDDPDVLYHFGCFSLRMGNIDRARDRFERFLEYSTDDGRRLLVRDALAEIERQAETDLLFREAYDFITLAREREGIDRIRRFLELHPDVWNAWFLLGWAHRRLEEYEPAREAFMTAIRLGSSETDTLNELAICQMELGEYDACGKTLEKALAGDPENVKIVSNMAILALKRGDIERAKSYFRTVLEYDPEDRIALEYLEYLRES